MEITYPVRGITQQQAAKLAGFLWVLTMATSIFATFYGFASQIVPGDIAKTMSNIVMNESTFRIGIVSMLFTSLAVVVLVWAFYVVLKPVNNELAMLGVFWRLTETALLCVGPVSQIVVLKYLSGARYLQAFEQDQLNALAYVSMSTYDSSAYVGFICLGLGSTVFAYLFLKSGYVPKGFTILGIFASLLLSLGSIGVILSPSLRSLVFPYGMIPMFFYEVGFGFWLWFKGIRIPSAA